jgi:hypothetical protein
MAKLYLSGEAPSDPEGDETFAEHWVLVGLNAFARPPNAS